MRCGRLNIKRRQLRLLQKIVKGIDARAAAGCTLDPATARVLETARQRIPELQQELSYLTPKRGNAGKVTQNGLGNTQR